MKPFPRFLKSRKLWVAIATVVATGAAASGGGAPAVLAAVAEIMAWVGPILMGTIAAEDFAEKWGNGK
jgi:hypothetical protein